MRRMRVCLRTDSLCFCVYMGMCMGGNATHACMPLHKDTRIPAAIGGIVGNRGREFGAANGLRGDLFGERSLFFFFFFLSAVPLREPKEGIVGAMTYMCVCTCMYVRITYANVHKRTFASYITSADFICLYAIK